MAEPLFLEERRRSILEMLKQHGRVSVNALSEKLNVSTVTIRQDLRALEEEGLLERTYGGAVLRSSPPPVAELSFETRREKHRAEKDAIGQAAAALVQDGFGIALDASSTAYAITPYLKRFDSLTVVTNSLIVAQQFLHTPRIRVLLPAGRLRRDSISVVGNSASLPDINLNIGFFGARGLSPEAGATEISQEEAEMKRAIIARCIAPVLVVDGSKWGQIAPYTFMETDAITHIITTDNAPLQAFEPFRARGAIVDMVSVEE
jgi:DeoR/GlpR family transcriptional regulator of sugar metabolism